MDSCLILVNNLIFKNTFYSKLSLMTKDKQCKWPNSKNDKIVLEEKRSIGSVTLEVVSKYFSNLKAIVSENAESINAEKIFN